MNFTDEEMIADSFNNLSFEEGEIKAYSDHRIVMSFALAAASIGDMVIDDPEAVEKSYPAFWSDLEKLGVVFRYLSK